MAEVLGLILDTTSTDIQGSSIYIRELHSGYFQLVQKEVSSGRTSYIPLETSSNIYRPLRCSDLFRVFQRRYFNQAGIALGLNLDINSEDYDESLIFVPGYKIVPEADYVWIEVDEATYNKYKRLSYYPTGIVERTIRDPNNLPDLSSQLDEIRLGLIFGKYSGTPNRFWVSKIVQGYDGEDISDAYQSQTPNISLVTLDESNSIPLDAEDYNNDKVSGSLDTFEADYVSVFGSMDSKETANTFITSKTPSNMLASSVHQYRDTLIGGNSSIYTNMVNISKYVLEQPEFVRIEVCVQYVLETREIRSYNALFRVRYMTDTYRLPIRDEVELELCGGLLRAFPVKDSVTECILSNCYITYGYNEEAS